MSPFTHIPRLLVLFLCLLATAQAQFSGSYAFTDGIHPSGSYSVATGLPTTFGYWTVIPYTGTITFDTTSAPTSLLIQFGPSSNTGAKFQATAATDITVTFSAVSDIMNYTGGLALGYTSNNWTNSYIPGVGVPTLGFPINSPWNNFYVGPNTFFVPAGNIFGFDVSQGNGSWWGNQSISFAVTSAIPEPSTYAALAGLAALGLAIVRRRKNAA